MRGIAASTEHIIFEDGRAVDSRGLLPRIEFKDLVRRAYEERVDLGARGFYATPGVDYNRETGRGNPFLYYTNGAAVAEVLVDRLTGASSVVRVDILMDLGRSINPAIDRGQVVGGFVQGLGWVMTEELRYSKLGELLTCSPSNYKIPAVNDIPADFRVAFLDRDNQGTFTGARRSGSRRSSSGSPCGPPSRTPSAPSPRVGAPAFDCPAPARRSCGTSRSRAILSQLAVLDWNHEDLMEADPMTEVELMKLAIEKTREGIASGQSPFGSIIVKDGEVVASTHNTVWRDTDPTAHAEVNCLRSAAKTLRTIDLKGCTLYSTCEPCPMCLSAIHWAKIDRVVFGATIDDAAEAGFCELHVAAESLAEMGRSPPGRRRRPAPRGMFRPVLRVEEGRPLRDLLN